MSRSRSGRRPKASAGQGGRAVDEPNAGLDDRAAVVFAFVGSGCLLILEILAARLLAPKLGVSLYTWTSVIGVVLAGLALGNYFGGRLADRRPDRAMLALIYVAASLASFAILGLVHYLDSLELPSGAPTILQVLWLTAVLFLVPSTILASATPLLTRLSLHSVQEGGRVVGRIQAAAALGSIAGTFLTGFVLVSSFGTRWIVAGVAATMLLLAVAVRPPWLRGRVFELGSLLAVIVAAGAVSHSGCVKESKYYCIRVADAGAETISENGTTRTVVQSRALYLDHLLHGVSNLENPTALYYDYERLYARSIALLHPRGSRIDAFFIGGGSYTFPRYVEHVYGGRIVVAEIDPEVTKIARTRLGLVESPRYEIHDDDARRVLGSLHREDRFDLVLGDAFNDYEVPFQLTTRQFNDLVARHLKQSGLYLLNVIDGVHYDFVRSEVRTLRKTFPYVGLMSAPGFWPPSPHGRPTYVLVAAKAQPARALPIVSPRELDSFVDRGHSVVLTDDHVPVDQLLAPVFSQALHG